MVTHSSILAWEIPWTEDPGQTTVHRVAKCWTWLMRLGLHAGTICTKYIGCVGFCHLCTQEIVWREKGETEWLLLHLAQVCWACSVCYHMLGGIRKEKGHFPVARKGRVKEQKICTAPLGSVSLFGLFGGGLWVSASLACNAASEGVWKAVPRTLAPSQLGPSHLSLCQLLPLACKRWIPVWPAQSA